LKVEGKYGRVRVMVRVGVRVREEERKGKCETSGFVSHAQELM
jgi:hypothetical protein